MPWVRNTSRWAGKRKEIIRISPVNKPSILKLCISDTRNLRDREAVWPGGQHIRFTIQRSLAWFESRSHHYLDCLLPVAFSWEKNWTKIQESRSNLVCTWFRGPCRLPSNRLFHLKDQYLQTPKHLGDFPTKLVCLRIDSSHVVMRLWILLSHHGSSDRKSFFIPPRRYIVIIYYKPSGSSVGFLIDCSQTHQVETKKITTVRKVWKAGLNYHGFDKFIPPQF